MLTIACCLPAAAAQSGCYCQPQVTIVGIGDCFVRQAQMAHTPGKKGARHKARNDRCATHEHNITASATAVGTTTRGPWPPTLRQPPQGRAPHADPCERARLAQRRLGDADKGLRPCAAAPQHHIGRACRAHQPAKPLGPAAQGIRMSPSAGTGTANHSYMPGGGELAVTMASVVFRCFKPMSTHVRGAPCATMPVQLPL